MIATSLGSRRRVYGQLPPMGGTRARRAARHTRDRLAAEIPGLLSLRVPPRTSCEMVRERALAKIANVEERIAELAYVVR